LSTNAAEPVALEPEVDEPRPAADVARDWGVHTSTGVLAPAAVALLALLVHALVPTRQELPMSWMDQLPPWQHPYPVVLALLLTISLLLAVAQGLLRPLRGWVRYYAPLVAGALGLVCVWELVTTKMAWMPQPFFPSPDEILGALIEDRHLLLTSTWNSLLLLLSGYAIGVLIGVVTGVLIGWFLRFRYWATPLLKFIGPMPATALVPLVMMLSKQSFICGIALIAFAVWFPVTTLTMSGIMNVRLSYLDVARTLGAGRLYLIFRVAIPSALPNIFVGLFVGLLTSFLTLIVAETVGVKAGLGWYLQWQKGYAEYAKVYASLLIMAVFFSTILTLLFRLRERVLRWQKGVIKW
jgi:NitT/TauT family transport system permease protein